MDLGSFSLLLASEVDLGVYWFSYDDSFKFIGVFSAKFLGAPFSSEFKKEQSWTTTVGSSIVPSSNNEFFSLQNFPETF